MKFNYDHENETHKDAEIPILIHKAIDNSFQS